MNTNEPDTMKIKDLPKDVNMRGVLFKIPKGHPECPLKKGYWYSQWGYVDGKAGVWVKKSMSEGRIYPLFLDKLIEALEFEIVE
jgi:hypothetical protein